MFRIRVRLVMKQWTTDLVLRRKRWKDSGQTRNFWSLSGTSCANSFVETLTAWPSAVRAFIIGAPALPCMAQSFDWHMHRYCRVCLVICMARAPACAIDHARESVRLKWWSSSKFWTSPVISTREVVYSVMHNYYFTSRQVRLVEKVVSQRHLDRFSLILILVTLVWPFWKYGQFGLIF